MLHQNSCYLQSAQVKQQSPQKLYTWNWRLPCTKSSVHKCCLFMAPPSLSHLPCHLPATPNQHQSPPASPVALTHPSIPHQSSFHSHSTDGMHLRPISQHFKSALS